jgi:antitoxin (DNA-binding transcriptional repressor) of toxin-antitoxin stability system
MNAEELTSESQSGSSMTTISVQEVQRDPQGFLHRIEAGEALLVVRDNQPVAEVKPVPRVAQQPRPFGLCKGEFQVPDDFDYPLPPVN